MIMGTIFLLIAAFVFFFAAFLFILVRPCFLFSWFFRLWRLSRTFVNTEKYAEQWWETLIKESFFAHLSFSCVDPTLVLMKGFAGKQKGSLVDIFGK